MKLYLVRHGSAAPHLHDHQRELNAEGKQEITAIANALAKLSVDVGYIFHSGLMRAEQTAEIIAKTLSFSGLFEAHPTLHSADSPAQIASEAMQSEDDILIVSHMPFLGRLVSKLVIGLEHGNLLDFETGTAVCLERTGTYWTIQWILQPHMAMSLLSSN